MEQPSKRGGDARYIIGLDIGGTKTAVLLGAVSSVQERPKVLKRTAFATSPADPASTLNRACREISALLEYCGESRPVGVGISCGGPLDSRRGVILSPPNLWGWRETPVKALLEARFRLPVELQNDANACALAEWKYGAGRGCRSMAFLTFGTGLGAGLILDGRLYSGASDMAGELGHIRLAETGPVGYGKAGSFEGFCSGGGLAQLGRLRALEQLQQGKAPAFCPTADQLDGITAKSLAQAAEGGDALAQEIYRECGRWLGKGLSILVDLINPERIVIGSIFSRSEALLRRPMEEVLERECLPRSLRAVQVVPAQLGEEIGDLASLSVAPSGGDSQREKGENSPQTNCQME